MGLRRILAQSGPGWLQSAITLGGGSLASSLYLGVLGGFSLLWLQPLAMVMGATMLAGIAYVTLSTGKRPFAAINEHINPVLGWGWALATLIANVVWALPQFALATAAVQQNLFPSLDGEGAKAAVCLLAFAVAAVVVWFYDSGTRGIRVFEGLLKVLVGMIVLSFVGVVVVMASASALDWGAVFGGFVPDLSLMNAPAGSFDAALAALPDAARPFWSERIVADQRDVMVTAAATAVGINMTFLLPCSMLARGWTRDSRRLAITDLVVGLLIPFFLATSCIVIAAGTQFHATPDPALIAGAPEAGALSGQYEALLAARTEVVEVPATAADREMASMLVRRDAFQLADSLAPLAGGAVSHWVFGIGVLGMAITTIIMLMLISGFTVCEIRGTPGHQATRRLGSMLPVVGVLGPFVWQGDAKFWLAVPTSVFGMMLLPIAYLAFFFMLNSRSLLGRDLPTGGRRLALNLAMLAILVVIGIGAGWSVWSKAGWVGVSVAGAFLGLALIVHFVRPRRVSSAA